MNIHLFGTHGYRLYGREWEEGVYGLATFNQGQMKWLVMNGFAEWFDISSPHMEPIPAEVPTPSQTRDLIDSIWDRDRTTHYSFLLMSPRQRMIYLMQGRTVR